MKRGGAAQRQGFTLLEVMVVAAILGIVIAAVGACLAAGMRVWDATRRYASGEPQLALACAMLERDIVNTFPFYSISFSGTVDTVQMPALLKAEDPASADAAAAEVRRVGTVRYFWARERSAILRKAWVYPRPEPPDASGEVVASSVSRFQFRFAGPGAGGETWRDTWTDASNMPTRVQVSVELLHDAGGGVVERTVTRMVTNTVVK